MNNSQLAKLKKFLRFINGYVILGASRTDAPVLAYGGEKMAVSYNKLWKMMIDKHISKTELTHLAGISTNAMAKLGRDEDVRVRVLEKLCTSLDCKLDDIVEFVPDSASKDK